MRRIASLVLAAVLALALPARAGSNEKLSVENQAAIADTVVSLLHAIDARDWKAVRAAFDETVEVDYTSLFGGKPSTTPAAELVAGWEAFLPGFDATQHMLGPVSSRAEPGGVVAQAHVRGYHYIKDAPGGEVWMVAGHYTIRLVRRDGWKIRGLTLTAYYQEGNRGLPDIARGRAKKGS
jgi:hypothetical protein